MRLIDADVLKQHIDKLPALPDGNFAGNHSALKALINMQPTFEPSTNCSELPNSSDAISRQDAIDAFNRAVQDVGILDADDIETVFGMLSPADVVPVVRCKDCKMNPHWEWVGCPMTGKDTRKPDDFCSYGERRKE